MDHSGLYWGGSKKETAGLGGSRSKNFLRLLLQMKATKMYGKR